MTKAVKKAVDAVEKKEAKKVNATADKKPSAAPKPKITKPRAKKEPASAAPNIEEVPKKRAPSPKKVIKIDIPDEHTLFALASEKKETSAVFVPDPRPAPEYQLATEIEEGNKEIHFRSLVANGDLLNALAAQGHHVPSAFLEKVLPAALRSNDVLLFKPEHEDAFLVGLIAATSKILNEQISKGDIGSPAVLFLCSDKEKLKSYDETSKSTFMDLDISFLYLVDDSETVRNYLSKQTVDVLFVTPKLAIDLKKAGILSFAQTGLCLFSHMHHLQNSDLSYVEKICSDLPQERTQKIFMSQENTGIIRELAFKYLEDPECFYLLPSPVNEKHPRQFAHALPATQKFQVLLGYLKTHKPKLAIVFANTKTVAEWIAYKLHGNGISVELATNHMPARRRAAIVNKLKEPGDEATVVVATDVVAKYLGFSGSHCVYHFDLPDTGEKFLDRLHTIEQNKRCISVAFVCEDYGYNIASIENALGFKIRMAYVDRNFANIKDVSGYPLEADGRVKKIEASQARALHVQERVFTNSTHIPPLPPVQTSQPMPTEKVLENQNHRVETGIPESTSRYKIRPQVSTAAPQPTDPPSEKFVGEDKKTPVFQSPSENQNKQRSEASGGNRFVRRDERARDAVESAVAAAKDQAKSTPPARISKEQGQSNPVFVAFSILQDAALAASQAARESLKNNVDENMPRLAKFLKKIKVIP